MRKTSAKIFWILGINNKKVPSEKYLNKILESEIGISPIKSLAIHMTNTNSSYGLSPFIDIKKLWEENKTFSTTIGLQEEGK